METGQGFQKAERCRSRARVNVHNGGGGMEENVHNGGTGEINSINRARSRR